MPWLIVSLIRLILPLSILFSEFWGILFTIVFADSLDVVYLDLLGVTDFSFYNHMDKFFDTYFYCVIAFQALKWKNAIAKRTVVLLLGYRMIGVILYLFVSWRPLLLIFPNVFLTYVVVYLFFLQILKKDIVKCWRSNLVLLLALTIPKLIQEYLFHVAEIPLYQWFLSVLPFI